MPDFLREVHERNLTNTTRSEYEDCSTFNDTSRGASMLQTILRLPTVKSESGYSRSTIYLRIDQGLWTKQVSLGARCVGWPAHEVAALNAARIAGKSDEEIRALLAQKQEEHRDLDAVVERLLSAPTVGDDFQIRRIKKRKLVLKDRISALEDKLLPDIIA